MDRSDRSFVRSANLSLNRTEIRTIAEHFRTIGFLMRTILDLIRLLLMWLVGATNTFQPVETEVSMPKYTPIDRRESQRLTRTEPLSRRQERQAARPPITHGRKEPQKASVLTFWIYSAVATDRRGYLVHECNCFVALSDEVEDVSQIILYEVYPKSKGFSDQNVAVRRLRASTLDRALEEGIQ